jgi:hypothetical protein
MGLSFHDEPSLAEAVGSLRFGGVDLNPIPEMGSISLDGSLPRIGPHDPDAIPDLEMITIGDSEERRDDDIGGSDDIQMVDE